jgi:hypothetical protein
MIIEERNEQLSYYRIQIIENAPVAFKTEEFLIISHASSALYILHQQLVSFR